MKRTRNRVLGVAAGFGAIVLAWACSSSTPATSPTITPAPAAATDTVVKKAVGGNQRPPGDDPSPSPSASPSPGTSPVPGISPAPKTSPSPGTGPGLPPPTDLLSCPLGKGVIDAQCNRTAPHFLTDVDTAINQLVAQRPELFNTQSVDGDGGYLVLNPDAYYAGVVSHLTAMGYCAQFDFVNVQVKNTQDFSESYDILLGSQHIRRGAGSYRASCSPAAFPLEPKDYIASIRVAFYGVTCPEGIAKPNNGEGILPVGCTGYVTATPKDLSNHDVDERLHGPDILWIWTEGHKEVQVTDYPTTAWNKVVDALIPGDFQICAEVKTIRGCLDGKVVPPTATR